MDKHSDLLEDLKEYAYDIANWRVDHIESRMEKAPDDYPDFAAASQALDEEKERLIQKLGGDFREVEPPTKAFLMYQSILIYEVYTQAVMDGGRVLYAFATGELPVQKTSPSGRTEIPKRWYCKVRRCRHK